MKKVNNFQECLEYVNRLGIVNKTRPIGWQQSDLCAIVKEIEHLAGTYPLKLQFKRSCKCNEIVFSVNNDAFRICFNYPS